LHVAFRRARAVFGAKCAARSGCDWGRWPSNGRDRLWLRVYTPRVTQTKIIAAVAIGVAAAAFAMAMRDRRDDAPAGSFGMASRYGALEERRAIEAERAERVAASNGARGARLSMVTGDRPGQLGPMFDGVRVGSAGFVIDGATEARIVRLAQDQRGYLTLPDRTHGDPRLVITFREADEMASALRDRWGLSSTGAVWIDDATRVAATVREDPGEITFAWEPLETIDHMIGPGDPSWLGGTPFSAVGATLDALRAALGRRLVGDGDAYRWTLPRMRDSAVDERADLTVLGGVVTRVRLQFDAPPSDVLQALRKAYGPGAGDLGPWRHGDLEITIEGHPPDGAVVYAARATARAPRSP
jgi:hypothetical protein